ncbi:tryptophan synthase alpha chain [Alphaproteobacteria bacterium]|nr:tryptophan synthase alpha chain [Alphaproteobacteria bacterium]
MSRIQTRFAQLKGRPGLVTFIAAGDPDFETCQSLLNALPGAGADIIELGMPFTDPAADGPAIQAASLRALKNGASMAKTLKLVQGFRLQDKETPIILMGYFNPVYSWGVERFAKDAAAAGVDGVIIVDLPPEEAGELVPHTKAAGLDFIVLTTPTTGDIRLPTVLENASGFIYYVSIAGVTGADAAKDNDVQRAMERIRRHTDLPVAVGFGVKTAENVRATGAIADAVVVGSAIVSELAAHLDPSGQAKAGLVESVTAFVGELAKGLSRRD